MHKEQLKLADLSNVKVGDTIWTIQEGNIEVVEIKRNTNHYHIVGQNKSYTFDGRLLNTDKYPSAFTKNPFENIGFQERWMMVSTDEKEWVKRCVFTQKNGFFISWSWADDEASLEKETSATDWEYAKEIEEPKELELTLEQIAEKFGVSVESIKIKK